MDILTRWLRSFLPELPVDDTQLAEDLTLRGIAVEGIFPAEGGGSRFEMDITTNRVDAMNHYGVAREVATIYDLPLRSLEEQLAAEVAESKQGEAFPVRIEAQDLCGRFTVRVVRGVTVKSASGTVAEYFSALSQKPISAPVDVTNFGWLAMGQPTHVFDLDTLEGGIVVRRAHAGEKLRLLDGTERTLVPDDLVVADEKKALGLAGVMGGWDSRVTDTTKNILVEAAWFDPAAIRASSRRHGLHTDASHRFERGADFNAAPLANNLVTRMLLEQAGGEVVGPMTDVTIPGIAAMTADRFPIILRVSEVQRHLGTTLEDAMLQTGERTSGLNEEVVAQYLTSLGCELTPTDLLPGEFGVELPSWRLDLEREIDLIEEVARVYGYNRFADTLPAFAGAVREMPHADQERVIRSTLHSLGYTEAVSSTFLSADEATLFGDAKAGAVPLGNPLSEEAGMLRSSLAAAQVGILAKNLTRDVNEVRLFELGTVFTGTTAQVHEEFGLALGATGGATANSLHTVEDALFFEVKGALEQLLAKFDGEVSFASGPLPAWIEPGRGASILLDGIPIAVFGELSAAGKARHKFKQPCVVAEVKAQILLDRKLRQPVVGELSRFQPVERDFSFIFPDSVRWNDVTRRILELQMPELQSVEPLEIFRDPKGKSVVAGSYSLLLRVVFQSAKSTLTDDEIIQWGERVTTSLTALGGTQRAPDA